MGTGGAADDSVDGTSGAGEGGGAAAGRQLLGRRDSTSFDTSRYLLLSYCFFSLLDLILESPFHRLTSEEVVRLNSGLEHILDIMGETVSEHVIKTTIVRYDVS